MLMKKLNLLVLLLSSALCLMAQDEIQKDLKPFSSVIASPRVNVILKKGDRESIRLVYNNVSKGQINIEVRHKTLQIYLDQARKVEKMSSREARHGARRTMYHDATI